MHAQKIHAYDLQKKTKTLPYYTELTSSRWDCVKVLAWYIQLLKGMTSSAPNMFKWYIIVIILVVVFSFICFFYLLYFMMYFSTSPPILNTEVSNNNLKSRFIRRCYSKCWAMRHGNKKCSPCAKLPTVNMIDRRGLKRGGQKVWCCAATVEEWVPFLGLVWRSLHL